MLQYKTVHLWEFQVELKQKKKSFNEGKSKSKSVSFVDFVLFHQRTANGATASVEVYLAFLFLIVLKQKASLKKTCIHDSFCPF